MKAKLNGESQNGHARPAGANGVNRLVGDGILGAAPLEPSATAAVEAPKPATEGRDASGRFAAGNRLGKGNPHARRMAALRQAFLSVATEERMKALGEKLYAQAVRGDWQAAKLFLLVVIGRPANAVDPDTLDREEWLLCQEWPEKPVDFAWLRKINFAQAVDMLRRMAELGEGEIVPLSLSAANPGADPTKD
jgi:hypothetical protein